MPFSDYQANTLLDDFLLNGTPFVSLHSGYPGGTGANEFTGGSYARQSATFGAASARAASITSPLVFLDLPNLDILAAGIWDAVSGGNFLFFVWKSSGIWLPFIVQDPANDLIECPNHGLSNNDRAVVTASEGFLGTLPAGLVEGTVYHVVSSTTDTLKLSLTQGGLAVDVTGDGQGSLRLVELLDPDAGDEFNVAAAQLVVRA